MTDDPIIDRYVKLAVAAVILTDDPIIDRYVKLAVAAINTDG